ncbi:MAG: TIGR03546 family protein [Pirellula sp.]|jgi:uncharacterized protein (TIGR03546 family)
MFRMLGRAAQRLLTEISQHRTPEQIAWGLAIGVSFGLVPMDSIISVMLLIAILILPVNHLCAAVAFVSMALVSRFVAPIPNALGLWILSHQWVVSALSVIYSLPLVPWLRLNNTMVVGGLFLGILSVAPNYITLRWLVRRTHSTIQQWSIDEVARQAPEFRKISSEKSTRTPTLSPSVTQRLSLDNPLDNSDAHAAVASNRSSAIRDVQQNESSHRLAPAPMHAIPAPTQPKTNHRSPNESKPTNEVTLRQSESKPAISIPSNPRPTPREAAQVNQVQVRAVQVSSAPINTAETKTTQGDTVLRETVIEVVRFREPLESGTVSKPKFGASSTSRIHDISIDSNALSGPHLPTETMNQELMIAEKNNSLGHVSLKTHTGSPVDPSTGAIQPPSPIGLGNHRQAITGHKGSDSLRYLLRHITGTKSEREGTDS